MTPTGNSVTEKIPTLSPSPVTSPSPLSLSSNVDDNEGEDLGSGNEVNNEGEDWGSDNEVDNEGENWSTPQPTTSSEPTSPKVPTQKPTSDPTIDLEGHLENLKTSYFCSESWESIDCANAEECPSGDSKGK